MMWLLIVGFIGFASADFEYNVTLTNIGPVTLGENVSITATLSKNGAQPHGNFIYMWRDDAVPQHKQLIKSDARCTWTLSSSNLYPETTYSVQVTVYKNSLNEYPKGESFTSFDIVAETLPQKLLKMLQKFLKKLWYFLKHYVF